MERQMYYEKPTQVFFYTSENEFEAGIAYHDEIICGCCGGIYSIEEVYEWANEDNLINPITELNWVNLTDEIRGDLAPTPIFRIPEDDFPDVDWEKLSKDIFHSYF